MYLNGIEAYNAKYMPAEMDKIMELTDEQLCEYGIIIAADWHMRRNLMNIKRSEMTAFLVEQQEFM